MPALVNISVGSLRGTSGDEATAVCPFFSKKPRKEDRISFTLCMARLVTRKGRLLAAATSGKAFYRGGYGPVYRDHGRLGHPVSGDSRQSRTPTGTCGQNKGDG